MKGRKLSQQVIGAIVIALLLAGCSNPVATTVSPTGTPTPVPPTPTAISPTAIPPSPTPLPPTFTPTPVPPEQTTSTAIPVKLPVTGIDGIKTSGDSLWAWSENEIWRYTRGEWSYYTAAIDNLADVAFISDTLWAMDNSRLQYFDGNKWQVPQGIYADEIEADDESGILWVLTGKTLFRWDVEEMSYIERRSIPGDDFYPHQLAVTGDGSVWASGIYGYIPTLGGLARYDDTTGSWERVRPWHDDEDVPAMVMAATPNGELWVMLVDWSLDWEALHEAGEPFVEWALAYWDSASGEWTIFEQDLPEGYPMVMAADDGGVWLAQGGGLIEQMMEFDGLVYFDGENWSYYLPDTWVDGIAIAPDGTIWYTTGDGEPEFKELIP